MDQVSDLKFTEGAKLILETINEGSSAEFLVREADGSVTQRTMSAIASSQPDNSIVFVFEGGGIEILPGREGVIEVPFDCLIKDVRIFSEQTGSIEIDILKCDFTSYPTFTSITGSSTPSLSSENKKLDNVLSGWDKTISAGDILRFIVNSVSGIEKVTISITVTKLALNNKTPIDFILDGGGDVILPGVQGDIEIPFDCIIDSVKLLADQAGDIIIDIWKADFTNFPPVVGDSITGSTKPTLSASIKYSDDTLTGWNTNVLKGDILRFNVDSSSLVKEVTISLIAIKT